MGFELRVRIRVRVREVRLVDAAVDAHPHRGHEEATLIVPG